MVKIIVLDSETTGLIEPDAVSIAYLPVEHSITELKQKDFITSLLKIDWTSNFSNIFNSMYCPDKPIESGASKVTGIYFEDVKDCPKSSTFVLPREIEYIIGHNSIFDWRVLNYHKIKQAKLENKNFDYPPIKLICTKELSQLAFEGQRNNKLTTLIEFLYPEQAEELLKTAHSALQDCKLSFLVLLKVLEKFPNITEWEQLAKLCSQGQKSYEELNTPVKEVTKMPFGKYKGYHLIDVPLDYINWLLNSGSNLQPDLEKALKLRLTK